MTEPRVPRSARARAASMTRPAPARPEASTPTVAELIDRVAAGGITPERAALRLRAEAASAATRTSVLVDQPAREDGPGGTEGGRR